MSLSLYRSEFLAMTGKDTLAFFTFGEELVAMSRFRTHCTTIAILAISLMAPTARAQEIVVPDGIPEAFDPLFQDAAQHCARDNTAEFPEESFTRPYDFNEDGVRDYFFDSSLFRCWPDSNLMYGGTAGTHYWAFVSGPDGTFSEKLHISAHAMQTVYMFNENRGLTFVFFHHGTACGRAGASPCVSALIWDNVRGEFVGRGWN